MNTTRRILTVAMAALLSLTAVSFAENSTNAAASVDFGDFASVTLASKAWAALEAKHYDDLKALVAKCQELYGAKAAEMQKSLKDFAPSGKEHDFWALNDCGTCQFILAKALDAQDQKKEAVAAYNVVIEKFSFAQCWDPQGWFWKPAEASKDRIKELGPDAAK